MTHPFPLLQIQTIIIKIQNCNRSVLDLMFYILLPYTSACTMLQKSLGRVSPDNCSLSTIYMYRLLELSGVHRTTDSLVSRMTGFEHLFITDRTTCRYTTSHYTIIPVKSRPALSILGTCDKQVGNQKFFVHHLVNIRT